MKIIFLCFLKRLVAAAFEALERRPTPSSDLRRVSATQSQSKISANDQREEIFTLITGGNGEIGRETVRRFNSIGHTVIIADRNRPNYELLEGKTLFYRIDLLDCKSISKLGQFILDSNIKLSHVVYLAGGPYKGEILGLRGISEREIDDSVTLNLVAPRKLTKILLPLMKEGGSFTFVGSINSMTCYDRPAYSAAKAGLSGFIFSILEELGKLKLRANIVVPGSIYNELKYDDRDFDKIVSANPLKALATCQEIAELIISVAQSTVLNGAEIIADKGQSKIPPSFRKVV